MDTFELITNTVSKDIGAFYAAANNKEGMSVHQIYESSRKYCSQYLIVDEALKLKEAIQFKDPVAQAKHQLQYNIKLGYAMQV